MQGVGSSRVQLDLPRIRKTGREEDLISSDKRRRIVNFCQEITSSIIEIANQDSRLISFDGKAKMLWGFYEEHKTEFNHINIAIFINRLAKLKLRFSEIQFTPLTKHVITLMGKTSFQAQNLSNIVHGYAVLGIRDLALFRSVAEEIVEKVRRDGSIGGFSPQGISNTAYAYAILGIRDEALFRSVADEIVARARDGTIRDFNLQNLSNTVYAYGLMCANYEYHQMNYDKYFYLNFVERLISLVNPSELKDKELRQLLQAASFFKLRISYDGRSLVNQIRSSALQERVGRYLRKEGFRDECNLGYRSGWHAIDFFHQERDLAVEVEGPYHYEEDGRPNPQTILRDRILINNGISVVSISYKELDRIADDQMERYLIDKGLLLQKKELDIRSQIIRSEVAKLLIARRLASQRLIAAIREAGISHKN